MLSRIQSLFTSRPPFAIFWSVVPIIVYAFERMLWAWLMTHIGKEIFKLAPSFADLNATPAVIFVAYIVRIVAPLPHANPTTVFDCVGVSEVAFPIWMSFST